jgi:hypothetical protein
VLEQGQRLELLHKTQLEGIPGALAAFKGRLLAGVGPVLRLYELGKKKLLRKCEYKQLPQHVAQLHVLGSRIVVGDVQVRGTGGAGHGALCVELKLWCVFGLGGVARVGVVHIVISGWNVECCSCFRRCFQRRMQTHCEYKQLSQHVAQLHVLGSRIVVGNVQVGAGTAATGDVRLAPSLFAGCNALHWLFRNSP